VTGSLLRPEDMYWLELPPTEIRPNYVARSNGSQAEYVGALARRNFSANEPFVADGLVKETERNFLAAVLAPGQRAITIAVDAPQSASGLILPGDRVDVILTQNVADRTGDSPKGTGGDTPVGETVLSNIRVVAIDATLGHTSAPNTAESSLVPDRSTPRSITLELSERDAEKLLVATKLGKIDISVRALATDAASGAAGATPPIWAADVSPVIKAIEERSAFAAVPGPIEQKPSAAPLSAPTHVSIEVMHGDKTEIKEFDGLTATAPRVSAPTSSSLTQ
jgi:pilus assembly protein CpaB